MFGNSSRISPSRALQAGRIVVADVRQLGGRRQQIARAFDELVLLRRGEAGEVERLLGDRRLALGAVLQQAVHLHGEDRQGGDQHQEEQADAEFHRAGMTSVARRRSRGRDASAAFRIGLTVRRKA